MVLGGRYLAGAGALTLLATAAGGLPPTKEGAWNIEHYSTCGGFLESPTFIDDDTLVASDPLGGNIFRISPEGKCETANQFDNQPNGLLLRPDGSLVVAVSNGLMIFHPATGETNMLAESYEGGALGAVNDLVADEQGGIYFTVPGGSDFAKRTGRVFYLAHEASDLQLIAENLAFPNGIAISPDGDNVLIAEFGAKRIVSYPSLHSKRRYNLAHVFAYTLGGIGPDGLAYGPSGELYVANIEAGTVSIFTSEGQRQADIVLPPQAGRMPTNVSYHHGWLYITEAQKGEIWRARQRGEEFHSPAM
ncbi:MAG: SMP-30/gluconolactonase/LRE family protein [Parasphingorhabdus sp.]|uniref:SMP-30/gluconolactonase/LRE family protein n=1 Tax=Parasphingorhabdus sp. TaxID=2709688 RepID=UPI0030029E5C